MNFKGKVCKKSGITLIALVITIIVLLILAGVTISTLFGDNGLITKAIEAKQKTEEAARLEQQKLAGAFEKDYVTYNGQLHVDGINLMNEHNESIQLKGVVLTDATSGKYSMEILEKVKNMGVNCIRLGLSDKANDIEEIEKLCQIIDNCIELDLYVDIIYWNSKEILNNLNIAKNYFQYIATKYADTENILYEICNEPTVEWDEIKEYANQIIPIIRGLSAESVILVGTPDACGKVTVVINNQLEYNNIMYVKHYYTSKSNNNLAYDNSKRGLSTALSNGIPIFLSEWSAGSADGQSLNEYDANQLSKIIKRYNISYCYYNLYADDNYTYCMIKRDYWNQIGSEESFTDSGKFFYNLINDKLDLSFTVEDNTLYNNGINSIYDIWDEDIRINIQKIEFLKSTDEIENAYKVYNLSNNGVGNIVAYVIENSNNLYDVKIISDNTIYLPKISAALFWKFEKLENIVFDNIDTSNVTEMQTMFSGANLKSLDLSKFNTENVINMQSMFANLNHLESLNLSSFNMNNVQNLSYMFINCSNLQLLDFSNAEFNSVSKYEHMFQGTKPKVIVKNQVAKDFILNIKNTLEVEIFQE